MRCDLLKIAYVSKAHGLKGEIFIRPLSEEPHWPHPIKKIFIGDSVFSVQNYSHHKSGVLFKLDDCSSREMAQALKGQAVFLPKKLFKSRGGERFYLAELSFFQVESLGQGKIGVIQSFQSDKFQDFLLVKREGRKNLLSIPLAAPYIKEISFNQKKLVLDLPLDFLNIF